MEASKSHVSMQRMSTVMARTGYCKSHVYNLVKAGELPPPIKIGKRAVAWPSDVIDEWIAERIRRAGSKAKGE